MNDKKDNKQNFNTNTLQRQLEIIYKQGPLVVYCRNNEAKIEKDIETDIGAINKNNFEEVQIIFDDTGYIIYGHLEKDDLPNQNAVIIGCKTRKIIDKYKVEDGKSPFYETNDNPVYYDTTNGKSTEIAFSNKMSLRGYLILEKKETDLLNWQKINPVPMDKKGIGLSTMNKKPWFYPEKGELIKFKEYTKEKAKRNIKEWDTYKNAPFIKEKSKRISLFIDSYNEIDENSKQPGIAKSWEDALKQKGILTSDLKWTVKNENSLKKRLYNNSTDKKIKIEKTAIEDKICIYNNHIATGKRSIDELKNCIITETDDGSDGYQWTATSINELGEKYSQVKSPRSNEEWLEILHLWEKSMGIEEIVSVWRETANLHLDTSGLNTMETSDPNISPSGFSNLSHFFTGDNKWKAKTIRELGDCYNNWQDKEKMKWEVVLAEWNKSHHIKVEYKLDKKFNTWTQGATEWGVNSTTNIGVPNETPFAGWSKFSYEGDAGVINFNTIREEEAPHQHPVQTEIYKVNKGTAYLMVDEKIETVTVPGYKIIEPMIKHCIVAIKSPYEHLVIQSPSGFHHNGNKKTTGGVDDMNRYYEMVLQKK